MDWVAKLAELRGRVISENKVDTIAQWIQDFVDKYGRLPEKEELLSTVESMCEVNLWNRNLVNRLKEHVFGESVEQPPKNPVEKLLNKLTSLKQDTKTNQQASQRREDVEDNQGKRKDAINK